MRRAVIETVVTAQRGTERRAGATSPVSFAGLRSVISTITTSICV
jgi:hypothetical protein